MTYFPGVYAKDLIPGNVFMMVWQPPAGSALWNQDASLMYEIVIAVTPALEDGQVTLTFLSSRGNRCALTSAVYRAKDMLYENWELVC